MWIGVYLITFASRISGRSHPSEVAGASSMGMSCKVLNVEA